MPELNLRCASSRPQPHALPWAIVVIVVVVIAAAPRLNPQTVAVICSVIGATRPVLVLRTRRAAPQ